MKINRLCIYCLVVLLAGCAGTGQAPTETVRERAQERWDLLIERNAGAAWEYYTPGYRETMDRRDFAYEIARRPVRWLKAEVLTVECETERCKVRTMVSYDVPSARSGMGNMQTSRVVEETWIRTKNRWWYVPPSE